MGFSGSLITNPLSKFKMAGSIWRIYIIWGDWGDYVFRPFLNLKLDLWSDLEMLRILHLPFLIGHHGLRFSKL